jgi:hypothetical protein
LGGVALLLASVSGYRERLTQTLCALALGGAVVIFVTTFLRFLLMVSLAFVGAAQELPYTIIVQLANFLLFPLFVWNVFLFAALFRRSFRPRVVVAFAIAIPLVFILDYWVPAAFKSL